MGDIRSCIHQVPIFQVLPEDSVHRLQQAMRHRTLQPGDIVITTGEPVDHLVVVARGLLKLSRISRSGREQVVRELGPGQFFGEMGLFTAVNAEADLVAVLPTDACMLPRDVLQKELAGAPDVAMALVEALASRLSEAERMIGDIALLDVGERLAAELLRLAESSGDVTVPFPLPFSWAELAARLATTPESLSRRLRRLVEEDIVSVDGRHVVVLDPDALRRQMMG